MEDFPIRISVDNPVQSYGKFPNLPFLFHNFYHIMLFLMEAEATHFNHHII